MSNIPLAVLKPLTTTENKKMSTEIDKLAVEAVKEALEIRSCDVDRVVVFSSNPCKHQELMNRMKIWPKITSKQEPEC